MWCVRRSQSPICWPRYWLILQDCHSKESARSLDMAHSTIFPFRFRAPLFLWLFCDDMRFPLGGRQPLVERSRLPRPVRPLRPRLTALRAGVMAAIWRAATRSWSCDRSCSAAMPRRGPSARAATSRPGCELVHSQSQEFRPSSPRQSVRYPESAERSSGDGRGLVPQNTLLRRRQLGAIAAELVGPVAFALLVALGGLLVSSEVDASLTMATEATISAN